MASNQPIKAIDVIKSDTINIPQPGSYITGTNSAGNGTTITDSSANFLGVSNAGNTGYSNKVAVGDVLYTGGSIVTVTAVTDDNNLIVSASVTGGATYALYKSNGGAQTQPVVGHEGYSLYVGGAGDLSVVPAASTDTVVLKGVAAGAFIPLQVVRVNAATTASDILALE